LSAFSPSPPSSPRPIRSRRSVLPSPCTAFTSCPSCRFAWCKSGAKRLWPPKPPPNPDHRDPLVPATMPRAGQGGRFFVTRGGREPVTAMFDIKWIRDNPEAFDQAMSRRKNVSVRSADLIAIDERRRQVILRLNEAQEKRNAFSKQIGQAKAQKDEARAAELMEEVSRLKQFISAGEAEERAVEKELRDALSAIPNMAF